MIKTVQYSYNIVYVIILLSFATQSFCQSKSGFEQFNPEQFYIAINEYNNSILVDCRDIKAYRKIAIEGSINLENKKQLKSYCDTLDRETPILVYCDVGTRSKQACKYIAELGFISIYNLKGGLHKWQDEGYPVKEIIKEQKAN